MIKTFLQDYDFSELMVFHQRDIIEMLLNKGVFFSILTHVDEITYEPLLPTEISDNFKPITLFVISEYTFESCSIDDDNLYFEAGFGHQNVGSYVTIPLNSIVQIVLEDTPIFINLSMRQKKEEKDTNIETSTNIFLSNPKNRRYIKKK
jgi:hypothetical protein